MIIIKIFIWITYPIYYCRWNATILISTLRYWFKDFSIRINYFFLESFSSVFGLFIFSFCEQILKFSTRLSKELVLIWSITNPFSNFLFPFKKVSATKTWILYLVLKDLSGWLLLFALLNDPTVITFLDFINPSGWT